MRKGLLIELIDPVITSANSSTTGNPGALEYIPGAMILGATATRGYIAASNNNKLFDYFHSGAVKFDDGLPIDENGNVGLPNPLSFHHLKATDPFVDGGIVDFSQGNRALGYEQLRGKAISNGLHNVKVQTSSTLRTAVDRDTGRAAESRLFGYQMLEAGQRFLSGIEAQDKDTLDTISEYLFGSGNSFVELFLGRSKSSEFGRVRISECDDLQLVFQKEKTEQTYFWCLSDLWAHDVFGLPTITPTAEFFCSSGEINWANSFTRLRRFSPYNGAWDKRAEEREVIQRGSLFTVEGSDVFPGRYRFGLGQEIGFGHVFVTSERPLNLVSGQFSQSVEKLTRPVDSQVENSLLVNWLMCGSERATLDVNQDLEKLFEKFELAKKIAGYPVGPGSTQWASLATILQRNRDYKSFLDGKRGEESRQQWAAIYGTSEGDNFNEFTRKVISEKGHEYSALLAKEVRKELEKRGWFDGK